MTPQIGTVVPAENAYPFEISSRFALGFERGCS